jgi:hypothetical protein
MPKLKTAAEDVPAFVTVADAPGESVVVEPTAMVAAAPFVPFVPAGPGVPMLTVMVEEDPSTETSSVP